jgi:hypothetical protein
MTRRLQSEQWTNRNVCVRAGSEDSVSRCGPDVCVKVKRYAETSLLR